MEGCERCEWWSKQGLSSRCPYHDGLWADELMRKHQSQTITRREIENGTPVENGFESD